MLLQKVILLGDHQGGKLKMLIGDCGLLRFLTDSTLESSNSATELNDLKKRIEQASTTVLGKTSPVPFTRRKTPWWNGLCRNAVLEPGWKTGISISLRGIAISAENI